MIENPAQRAQMLAELFGKRWPEVAQFAGKAGIWPRKETRNRRTTYHVKMADPDAAAKLFQSHFTFQRAQIVPCPTFWQQLKRRFFGPIRPVIAWPPPPPMGEYQPVHGPEDYGKPPVTPPVYREGFSASEPLDSMDPPTRPAPKMRLAVHIPDGPQLGIEHAYLPGHYHLPGGWKWADGKPSWEVS